MDGNAKPDLLAPGRSIVSALPAGTTLDLAAPLANHVEPGYVRLSGTSFSAPQVAGAVADLLERSPALTPDQVKWLLATTGVPVAGASAPELNLAAAVSYLGPARQWPRGLSSIW